MLSNLYAKCCFKQFKYNSSSFINELNLTDGQKRVIKKRCIQEISRLTRRAFLISVLYYCLRFSVTFGGVLITSLLLLTKISFIDTTGSMILFWICWALSLIVGLSNECIYAFGIDNKFYHNSLVLEKLKSEFWKYIELTGKYSSFPSHKAAYNKFAYTVETLYMSNVMSNLEAIDHSEPVKTGDSSVELVGP